MREPVRRPRTPVVLRGQGPVVAVVALGGALGACARYGAALLWPTPSGAFPWTTLVVNVAGCAVIGVFMVLITDVWAARPHASHGRYLHLLRPFFGTGVLGGFTTFSTYAVETQRLLDAQEPGTALGYLGLTLVGAVSAVWLTATVTRRLLTGRLR
nr:CrcB family protein [Streptomyces spirodelae]